MISEDKSEDKRSNKEMALSAKSKWLEEYSMLMSNGFKREIVKVWKRDGKIFKSNEAAIEYLKELMEGK